jgi:hypothetical protein
MDTSPTYFLRKKVSVDFIVLLMYIVNILLTSSWCVHRPHHVHNVYVVLDSIL